jgi:hypothetical protein
MGGTYFRAAAAEGRQQADCTGPNLASERQQAASPRSEAERRPRFAQRAAVRTRLQTGPGSFPPN